MVSSLQGCAPQVQQGSALGAMDRVTPEQVNRPGLYSLDQAVMADIGIKPPKKHDSILGSIGNLLVDTVVLGAVAVGVRKGLMGGYKVEEVVPEKGLAKAKHYFAKYTDLVYDKTVGKVLEYIKTKKSAAPKNDAAAEAGAQANDGANINTNA